MKIKTLLLLTIMSITLHAKCQFKYQIINGKKMASNCEWKRYLDNKKERTQSDSNTNYTVDTSYNSEYDFSLTFQAESHGKFDAVNRNDSGTGMSLGVVQLNSRYAKELSRHLGIKPWMTTREIKRRLRTSYSKKKQLEIFNRSFVVPILNFASSKNIVDKRVIEFLVDWRVNGLPKSYYSKIDSSTTLKQLVALRNRRYVRLHRNKPKKYTKRILKHWLKRSNSFLS